MKSAAWPRVEIDEAQFPIRGTARPAKVGQQHAEQVAATADQGVACTAR